MQFFLPPEGAGFLEPCACTIPTVSALPDFVRPLNLQLSVNQRTWLTLAIVLSPVKIIEDDFHSPQRGQPSLNIVLALYPL